MTRKGSSKMYTLVIDHEDAATEYLCGIEETIRKRIAEAVAAGMNTASLYLFHGESIPIAVDTAPRIRLGEVKPARARKPRAALGAGGERKAAASDAGPRLRKDGQPRQKPGRKPKAAQAKATGNGAPAATEAVA